MTYLQPRNPKSGVSGLLVILVIVVILVVGVQFFAPHILPGIFSTLARPFWRLEFAIESGLLSSEEKLMSENEALQREVEGVDVRLQQVTALEKENAELKAMLGRGTTTPLLLAAVLRRPPLAPYDQLIIDVGADFDLASGTPVFTPEQIRIGYITEVQGQTSKVRLLSSPGERFDVLIGDQKEPAIAVGRGGGQYEARVSHEANVKEGDFVTIPSLNDTPAGAITAKISDPSEPFDVVLFAPSVNIYKLRWVLVGKSDY
jgi:rod shape-determining protein MreC